MLFYSTFWEFLSDNILGRALFYNLNTPEFNHLVKAQKWIIRIFFIIILATKFYIKKMGFVVLFGRLQTETTQRDFPPRVYAGLQCKRLRSACKCGRAFFIAKKEILHRDRQMQCSLYENEKPMNVTGGP